MRKRWIVYDRPMPENPPLHPRRGTHDPVAGTPARRPGSIRRTATTDLIRPQGANGDLVLQARGRDLLTTHDDRAVVVAEASVTARIDFMNDRVVREISTSPAIAGVERLVGVRTSLGFRRVVNQIAADEEESASLLYLLLDDVPVATLISGYAVTYAGLRPMPDGRNHLTHPDLCAGWRTGGTILTEISRSGVSPVVTGPPALSLHRPGDPLAWHDTPLLPPNAMRRHRRLDLTSGDPLEVDVLFRDSHMSFGGAETIIHEYTVRASVEPTSLRIRDIEAVPHALPFLECPAAADSAPRLAQSAVTGLREKVMQEFLGPTTCTHLNDTLRSLEDVSGLARTLGNAAG